MISYGPLFQAIDNYFYEEWKRHIDYEHKLAKFRQHLATDFPLPTKLLTLDQFAVLKEENEKAGQKDRLEKLQNNPQQFIFNVAEKKQHDRAQNLERLGQIWENKNAYVVNIVALIYETIVEENGGNVLLEFVNDLKM